MCMSAFCIGATAMQTLIRMKVCVISLFNCGGDNFCINRIKHRYVQFLLQWYLISSRSTDSVHQDVCLLYTVLNVNIIRYVGNVTR